MVLLHVYVHYLRPEFTDNFKCNCFVQYISQRATQEMMSQLNISLQIALNSLESKQQSSSESFRCLALVGNIPSTVKWMASR